jgi:hypothetical protein
MDFSVKASDLVKDAEDMKKLRKKNYKFELQKCFDHIRNVNKLDHQYTTYTVPIALPSDANYNLSECAAYLKEGLRQAEFYVKLLKPGNVLFISWIPEDVVKVQKRNKKELFLAKEKRKRQEAAKSLRDQEKKKLVEEPMILEYDPMSPISNMQVRLELMRNNPNYAHLKSLQKLKKVISKQ